MGCLSLHQHRLQGQEAAQALTLRHTTEMHGLPLNWPAHFVHLHAAWPCYNPCPPRPPTADLRGGVAAQAPRALQERMAVSQGDPGQRQLGYVVVTRPVRQGRLRLALEEVLSMQLDPAPTLPTATSPSSAEGAAALPPGSTASPPAVGAAGAAATASPSEGGAGAAAATSALLPGALLGLGLGVASEGSEASSLGSRASSSSNLRCAGATLVRSKHSYSCMADAAAAAPLRMLLVEDNAINMKASSMLHWARCGRQLLNGSVAGGGQGLEEVVAGWKLGVAVPAAAHARVGKLPSAKAWPAGSFTCGTTLTCVPQLHTCLRRRLLWASCAAWAAPTLSPRRTGRQRWRPCMCVLLTGIVAHRDCCPQGSGLAACSCSAAGHQAVGYTRLGCAGTVHALCMPAAGLQNARSAQHATPGWLQLLSLRCYLQFYPLSRPTPPPGPSTWHCCRRLAGQTRLMSSSWTCTCRAR